MLILILGESDCSSIPTKVNRISQEEPDCDLELEQADDVPTHTINNAERQ